MSTSLSRYTKLSFVSPNSESRRESYAFRKIAKWAGLKQETQGHRATWTQVGRPHTKPKPCQTWSKASLHIIGPKGRSVCRRPMMSPDAPTLPIGPGLLWRLLTDHPKSVADRWSTWRSLVNLELTPTLPWSSP